MWLANRLGKRTVFAGSLLASAIVLPGLMLVGDWLPVPLAFQGVAWMTAGAMAMSGIIVLTQALAAEMQRLKPKAVKKEITLILDAPDILLIEADRDKLQRLFLNLFDNAINYSRPGDKVTVCAKVQAGLVCVLVTDTGPGIPAQHLPHLFDRFYQVDNSRARVEDTNGNSSGAGLGLSIVQWLTQAHNGRIEVESTPEQGTTFTVWLPLTQTDSIIAGAMS